MKDKRKRDKLINFLNVYSIPYLTEGPNVGKSNINIKCPLCDNDPSYHMGLNYKTGAYGCWRDSSHRGKDMSYVLMRLVKLPLLEIRAQIGLKTVLEKDDVADIIKELSSSNKIITEKSNKKSKYLKFPKYFVPLWLESLELRYLKAYLSIRGFEEVNEVAYCYNLMGSVRSESSWKHRIIFPVYMNNTLVTWTGRIINNLSNLPRYKDLSIDESIIPIKECLFNYDDINISGGEVLYITEGPFDAMKLDWYLPNTERATCLFTKTISKAQINLLWSLKNRFDKFVIMLDADAQSNAITIQEALKPVINANVLVIDHGDPGDMSKSLIKRGFINDKERETKN